MINHGVKSCASSQYQENEDQLWRIIEKQRLLIQDLQKALAKVTADRDNLLTRNNNNNYNNSNNNNNSIDISNDGAITTVTAPSTTTLTATRPSVQHDSSHSNSSNNSSDSQRQQQHHQQQQGPTPPPRSPYRQHLKEEPPHRVDSLCDNSKKRNNNKNNSKNRKDINTRSSSLPVAKTKTTGTTPTITTMSNSDSRPASPSSTDSATGISSPVNAIMDKDAQLFARYQESQKRDGIWKISAPTRRNNNGCNSNSSNSSSNSSSSDDAWLWPPPPPPPPTPPAQKKTQQQLQQLQQRRHVRRASSHPAISTTQQQKKNYQHQTTPTNTVNDSCCSSLSGENSLAGIDIKVLGSNITTNAKGKGVISFTISVRKEMDDIARELWRIEKLYSDFLALDSKLKQQGRPKTGKISKLPDKALFATHTPNKADQRKIAIEKYLQHMIDIPWHDASSLFDFLSSNRVDRNDESSQFSFDNNFQLQSTIPGRKEGYLTKRGKSFGSGWRTRYFVLDGPTLRYYESRDGTLQGTIHIPDTQIARQHAQSNTQTSSEMRHAFLIVEPKKPSNPGSGVNRHLLCAESDEERDQWVEALTQYLNWGGGSTPTVFDSTNNNHSTQLTNMAPASKNNNNISNSNGTTTGLHKQLSTSQLQQASSSSPISPAASPSASRKVSKDDIKPVSAMPLSQFNIDLDQSNKFTYRVSSSHYHPQRSSSADSNVIPTTPFSDSETVVSVPVYERPAVRQRSSMDHAYLPNMHKTTTTTVSAAAARRRGSIDIGGAHNSNNSNNESLANVSSSTIITTPNVDVGDGKKKKGNRRTFWAKKIFAGDMGTSIPSTNSIRGFLTRNSSDASSAEQPISPFHQTNNNSKGGKSTSHVFGVPLEEAIRVCKISENYELPAVVYRCIEYLEAKNATQEEGIYRLSGSAVKIKTLKQQFDQGVDINLLESDEYHDIHAVAGLLKLWLRELPGNVLTHDLLKEFIPVIDLVDRDERVQELGRLVSMLPLANYTLLRLLCSHLIRVINYADINKMNARNVGIIFSPTLQIPAGIFNLFLSEFRYIFWTTNDTYESNKLLIPTTSTNDDNNQEEEEEEEALEGEDDQEQVGQNNNDYFAGSLHPTQPAPSPPPRPRYSNGRLQQMLLDEQGRSNRNSVHYMDGAPSSIVGLENGNAIISDDDADVEDLEIQEDDSSITDDEDKDVDEEESDDYDKKSTSITIRGRHYPSSTNSETTDTFNNSSNRLLTIT
ncbi:hypothetical protein INT45_003998 [Circinella minor]|uniref:RalA-binding protein 1 n=1 Tax=Circinella minor TaxID=1195481 RepID=A0A8H7RS20_9FUNG|nr:hypothetical protein INT45_003998 [Circinella minor]